MIWRKDESAPTMIAIVAARHWKSNDVFGDEHLWSHSRNLYPMVRGIDVTAIMAPKSDWPPMMAYPVQKPSGGSMPLSLTQK